MLRAALRRAHINLAVVPSRSSATTGFATAASIVLGHRSTVHRRSQVRFRTSTERRYDQLPDWKPAETAKLDQLTRCAVIRWSNGTEDRFPYVWLRDNCLCDECFVPPAQRVTLMSGFDVDVTASDIRLESDGQSVVMKWFDGHESRFKVEWLQYRCFSSAARRRRDQLVGEEKQLWGSEYRIAELGFHDVLKSDPVLLDFLLNLDKFGLVLLTGAPCEPGQTAKVCNRVAFMRRTHHGTAYEVVRADDSPNKVYTSDPLGLHIDLPYYHHVPGVQMLHCVTQVLGKGGENQFTDAFQVAAQLKTEQPDAYKMLTTQSIDFWDYGANEHGKFFIFGRKCVIELKSDGEVKGIHYNNGVRKDFINAPVERVEKIYHALKAFDDGLYDKRNLVEYKMNDGDIVFYDNTRVLHGRSGFSASGKRHLQGSYFDWDEARSRIRVLKTALDKWVYR